MNTATLRKKLPKGGCVVRLLTLADTDQSICMPLQLTLPGEPLGQLDALQLLGRILVNP